MPMYHFPRWIVRVPLALVAMLVLTGLLGVQSGLLAGFLLLYASGLVYCLSTAKTFAEAVLWGIAACFLTGFFLPPGMQATQPEWLRRVELPNADVESWWVDRDHLYLASTSLGRIQKYTADGRFIEAWHVPNYGKRYSIISVEDGRPVICNARKRVQAVGGGATAENPATPSCAHQANVTMRANPAHSSTGFAEITLADGKIVKIWNAIGLLVLWSLPMTATAALLSLGLATALRHAFAG
jgi:hypothetical protein